MATINVLKTVISASDDGFSKTFAEATTSAKHFNQMLKEGEALYKATRTPLENYEAEVGKLNNLLREGAISQETHNRAMANAADAYKKADPSPLTKAFSQMVPVFDPISLALRAMSIGFDMVKDAASALADVLVNSVASGIERLDALDDAANKIGVTTEALSALRFAAGYADIEIGVIDSSLAKMTVNMGKAAQEGGKAAEAFEKIGLDAKELRAAGPEEAFGMIADAINRIPNSTDRAVAAQEIFGKSWREIVPLLQLGSKGIEEVTQRGRDMGQVISAIDASTAAQAADAIHDLEQQWIGLQNVLAVEVAPIVRGIAEAFGVMFDGDMLANARAFFDAVLKDLQIAINMADLLGRVMINAFAPGQFGNLLGQDLIGDKMMAGIEKARAKAIKDAIDRTRKPDENKPDFADIGNDGASALGNTTFDREADRLRESLRTPIEVLQDELTKFGDMFAEGSIDVETLNKAIEKAEADFEKIDTAAQRKADDKWFDDLAKKFEEADKLKGSLRTPKEIREDEIKRLNNMFAEGWIDAETRDRGIAAANKQKQTSPSIAALEQGSAAAFSAINAARNGDTGSSAAETSRRQLEVARRQQKLQEQIAANTARKPMIARLG